MRVVDLERKNKVDITLSPISESTIEYLGKILFRSLKYHFFQIMDIIYYHHIITVDTYPKWAD